MPRILRYALPQDQGGIPRTDVRSRQRRRAQPYRDSETDTGDKNERRYNKGNKYYNGNDPLAVRLSEATDALHVDTSYKPLMFHWMDACQEKFDYLTSFNSRALVSVKKDNVGKLRSLREITLQITVDHCTSLTAEVLTQTPFLPVGLQIWQEVVRQGKDSLRVYKVFLERFPREMSQHAAKLTMPNNESQLVRHLNLSTGIPDDLAYHIGNCMDWLVFVDIYEVASAKLARDGLLSLLHVRALVGLKFAVNTPRTSDDSVKNAPILDDGMLKAYASAMKHDGRWRLLRVLVITAGDGRCVPRGITKEGMNAIMGVKGCLRYVECHKDLMPMPFRDGQLVRGRLTGAKDGRADGGWMSLRAWPVNSPAALHWKCLKIMKIVQDEISEFEHKPVLDISIARPHTWYKNLKSKEAAKENNCPDFIINGYILSTDDRTIPSSKRQGAINKEVEMTKRRKGIVPKRRTNSQSLDQMMADFLR
ncbi:hypothetical protein V1517DRAFT_345452 [Lipomyces orientalis]|uniref:Uncharacterized protein n=1 Tax=Lipomyces orientalis TaxID=1233043 RepID=A0ACC3TQ22_9ASCO